VCRGNPDAPRRINGNLQRVPLVVPAAFQHAMVCTALPYYMYREYHASNVFNVSNWEVSHVSNTMRLSTLFCVELCNIFVFQAIITVCNEECAPPCTRQSSDRGYPGFCAVKGTLWRRVVSLTCLIHHYVIFHDTSTPMITCAQLCFTARDGRLILYMH
jgi:hypothetical protein